MSDDKLKENIKTFLNLIDKLYEDGIIDIFEQINQSDFRILNYLLHNNNAHPSDIASSLLLTRSNTAAALKNLENKGYLTRVINETNRRQIFVSLTEEGKNYVNLCNTQLELLLKGWFSVLSQEEINTLFSLVKKALDPKSMSNKLKEFTFGG